MFTRTYWKPKYADIYKENLSNLTVNINIQAQTSIDILIDSVVEKIRVANTITYKKPFFEMKQTWFACKCARSRKQMFKQLNTYRQQYTEDNKISYNVAKSNFETLCKNMVKSSKDWWQLANAIKSRSFTSHGTLCSDEFYEHFKSMLQKKKMW